MQFIIYIVFFISIYFIAIIPFWFLYGFSDFLAFLLYYVFSYRKKTILKNLRNSFPGKSEKEINSIAWKNYRNLSDIVIESIKAFTISSKRIIRRFKIVNPELLDEYYNKNQSIIGVAGHYGNWEWGALAGGLQIKHKGIAVYKPLSNKYIDKFLRRTRAANGATLESIKFTSNAFEKHIHEVCIFMLVADQSPTNMKEAIWTTFLNQETACLHGPEKYAKRYNYPVVFVDIQRVKRGYYELEFSKLVDEPLKTSEGEITRLYMSRLEKIINAKPENWLWSHRRWKRKRKKAKA
ncbi:MAG: hypothetical protein A2X13_00160 [Bacteroidetes bacterium GWC2_33_15]|nr:MAG: hypothetical protein A2X10_03970 [Bacteroidetes bacterium GWA2_33_15]OFX51039.1 MAG: hypothetical protein A2X13_00160 [Bacteroidetes bacterium GWC2_33_15]OFX65662.1 MAG: hypothetical protein A2X15_13780 [Bacteroidetes bacterium GWB2_32_14]OFX70247.1 MAG: hypothetical protein A2X14_03050 [Bacteroidetes bacterium GWD2_33_33]HAN17243.1 hypothetical protein [Bacteroidales bacterium]